MASLLTLLPQTPAHAACAERFAFTFSDGQMVCLEDYKFMERLAPGYFLSIYRSVPPSVARFAIALPRMPAMCPAAIGLATNSAVGTSPQPLLAELQKKAREACASQAGATATGGGQACECVDFVASGQVSVSRNAFERMALGAARPAKDWLNAAWQDPELPPRTALAPLAAAAGRSNSDDLRDCPDRLRVRLADGMFTCLSSHPVGERRAPGMITSLARSVPAGGAYAVAVPAPADACPSVFGWGHSPALPGASTDAHARRALNTCQARLKADAAPATCHCVLLLADGASSLASAEFAALARLAEPAESTTQSPPLPGPRDTPGTATSGRPAAVAAAGHPVAATSAASSAVGTNGAEYAALREQVNALQALVVRQQSSTAAATPTPAAANASLRVRALVIGNGNYAHMGTLPNPANDARAVADKFRQFGIEVDLLLDADRASLVRGLANYQAKAAQYDVNIFFYAGHGLQVDGINYVVPVEMSGDGASAGSVKLNAIALNDALEYMPAKTRLVFLDACRDNPLSRSLRATRSGAGAGLAPVNTVSGTLVAYATKDGSTAEDGRGRNSPYTEALLKHLDADADIAIVLRRVRQSVLDSTSGRQEPWEYGSLVGDQLVLSRLARR